MRNLAKVIKLMKVFAIEWENIPEISSSIIMDTMYTEGKWNAIEILWKDGNSASKR